MLDTFKETINDAEISVFSHYPETINNLNIRVFENITTINFPSIFKKYFREEGTGRQIIGMIYILSSFLTSLVWIFFYKMGLERITNKLISQKKRAMFQEQANADIILSCGGGFLHDSFGGIFLTHLYPIFFAKLLLNKPVIIYAQSIGPFKNRVYLELTRFVLNRVNLITVRETLSQQYLEKIRITDTPIHLSPDAAFLLHPASKERIKKILAIEGINKKTHPVIGVTTLHWIFPNYRNIAKIQKKYENSMVQIIDQLIERLNAKIIFIPMVDGPAKYDNDRKVSERIIEQSKHKNSTKIISSKYTPNELKGIIGEMDFFIGTRMHSNILATGMYVPTVAIAYSPKTRGIMKMLNQEKFVCEIEDIDPKEVMHKVEQAWAQKHEIKKELKTNISLIQKNIRATTKQIKNMSNPNSNTFRNKFKH